MVSIPSRLPAQFTADTVATEYIAQIGRSKIATVTVDNPSASVFDVIGYNYTEQQAADQGVTRQKVILESGISDLSYSKATTGPMEQVGVEMTTDNGDMTVEINGSNRTA